MIELSKVRMVFIMIVLSTFIMRRIIVMEVSRLSIFFGILFKLVKLILTFTEIMLPKILIALSLKLILIQVR